MMTQDDAPGQRDHRTRWVLGALPAAFATVEVTNAVADPGPGRDWLTYGVLVSAFLVLATFGIRIMTWMTWQRSGGVGGLIDATPAWFVRLAAGLVVVWLAIAVIIAVS